MRSWSGWLVGIVVAGAATVVASGSPGARATGPAPPAAAVATAIPTGAEAIKVDGELIEETWTRAVPITEFVQREPHEGAAPSHQTEVRVLYDQTAIYVAVRALDPHPEKVVGHLTRRDEGSPSDWVRVMIDSYHDRRTAYEFSVNAAGVKQDQYWYADTNNDDSWDAVWDVAVVRNDQGWRAEFKIPFSQLRFNPASAQPFGFAVVRTVAHLNETMTWPLLARSASGYVSSFGDLTGLAFSGTRKKLEVAPYVLSSLETAPVPSGSPLEKSPDPKASAGVDLKYQVGAGLTLTATVNPDFGQVEADPAVVNLGAFETYFNERRPFFVEGSGNFAFGLDCNDGACTGLFYSRRIGRAPHRSVDAPENGYSVAPENTTILGAAKLTGRVGKFSIGALNAITSRENARIASPLTPGISTTPVEPGTSYSLGRVSREFTNNSRVSFMVTSTNRALVDGLRFLPDSAVTGGVDTDVRFKKGVYSVTGYWAGSTVHGTADAIDEITTSNVHSFQRPDATHLTYDPTATRLSGHAGAFNVNKISGEKTRFTFGTSYKTPGFEVNDLGFQSRADDISTIGWFQWRNDKPHGHVRTFRWNLNQWSGWNFGGDIRSMGGNVNAHWTFTNNWDTGTGFNVNAQGFDDRLTRGGPGGYVPGNVNQWGYFDTDNRKAVSFNLFGSWFNRFDPSWGWSVGPGLTWRPKRALAVSGSVNFDHSKNNTQWVENVETAGTTHYVFGRIDQTTVRFGMRVNYTMTPTLSLQLYAQPFVSAGGYSNFKELVNGRAAEDVNRYAPYAYGGDPNFNYRSFRTTNVLRWEYRPGSVIFVVWQQGKEQVAPYGDFQFNRDFGDMFAAPATNVFLVKISRWFNF
jgi:hypothetical protein